MPRTIRNWILALISGGDAYGLEKSTTCEHFTAPRLYIIDGSKAIRAAIRN